MTYINESKVKKVSHLRSSMFDDPNIMPITDIHWQIIEKSRNFFAINEVRASFNKNSKTGPGVNLLLTIGGEVGEKLRWKKGDRVLFYSNPSNPYHLRIVKTDSDGYLLSQSGTYNLACGFAWNLTKENPKKASPVFYEVMSNLTLEVKLK